MTADTTHPFAKDGLRQCRNPIDCGENGEQECGCWTNTECHGCGWALCAECHLRRSHDGLCEGCYRMLVADERRADGA
jgi:hypothetical protein